jgi:hypothetical protein
VSVLNHRFVRQETIKAFRGLLLERRGACIRHGDGYNDGSRSIDIIAAWIIACTFVAAITVSALFPGLPARGATALAKVPSSAMNEVAALAAVPTRTITCRHRCPQQAGRGMEAAGVRHR